MSDPIHPVVLRFIEEAGNTTQSFGAGRVIGQVYAYLYFGEEPRTLDDMRDALAISKGSASITVRQLEQWGAVQRVWVRGDRKDYYKARDQLGKILKAAILETVGQRMGDYAALLDEADVDLAKAAKNKENGREAFLRDRIQHIKKYQRWAQQLWNSSLLQRMLK